VLQHVAECCSVLLFVAVVLHHIYAWYASMHVFKFQTMCGYT
jgi:hypothetical protein